jgi:two-component system chemotaxis response regulator CheB
VIATPLLARPPTPPAPAEPARVLLCDDSITVRGAIGRMLAADDGVRVVARVANGRDAVEEVTRRAHGREAIDVVVLDIEMPVMDGMTALPLLLRADPGVRVIMASTLTTRGADIAMRALRLGAADYVPKPSTAEIASDAFRQELLAKVKGLARLRRRRPAPVTARTSATAAPLRPSLFATPPAATPRLRAAAQVRPHLLAIGSSTGGPQALFTLVQGLGARLPVPVVLTQHMPPTFTPILAQHLDRLGGPGCAEARDGETLLPGRLYVAPGDRHLLIEGTAGALRARLSGAPPENFCRPAVDPMLRSAAVSCQGRVLVVMLTGMGRDGLAGTETIIAAGGTAIAQDEATSVVWGMPGAVAQAGLCSQVLPLPDIAGKVLDMLRVARP